jgi:hypothetical protein
VTLIAIVHLGAAALHVVFWSVALARLPQAAEFGTPIERGGAAFTQGFGIADLLWSVPLLFLAGIGLLKLRDWGWLAAQLAHVLYWYSLTVILTRDFHAGSLAPGTILFGPFTLFAAWAAVYLWLRRDLFWRAA